jgi:hypothetical protein
MSDLFHLPFGPSDDFYKPVDEAFDVWYDTQRARSNMGSCCPWELTAIDPPHRRVEQTRIDPVSREELRPVHPEVAAETERLQRMKRPNKDDVSSPFSPSKLACYRAGFSEGVGREKSVNNQLWVSSEHSTLKRAVRREGADYARRLLDQVIAELVKEDEESQ